MNLLKIIYTHLNKNLKNYKCMEEKPILNIDGYTITWRNLKLWFKDQFKRKTWFRNMFITFNAWSAFSINSHINQHTKKPKVMYNTEKTANKSAGQMSRKYNTHFSYYKCLFCDGYHVGKNRDNKTEYDKLSK